MKHLPGKRPLPERLRAGQLLAYENVLGKRPLAVGGAHQQKRITGHATRRFQAFRLWQPIPGRMGSGSLHEKQIHGRRSHWSLYTGSLGQGAEYIRMRDQIIIERRACHTSQPGQELAEAPFQ
jgi:hypothetical protein